MKMPGTWHIFVEPKYSRITASLT